MPNPVDAKLSETEGYIILGLDTAMNGCTAALGDMNGNMLKLCHETMTRGQAEAIVPMIDDLCREQNIAFPQIRAVAVTRGPGAFTGVRIGLATARALGVALGVSVLGLTTFELLEAAFRQDHTALEDDANIMTLIETKRRDYYFALSNREGQYIVPPTCLEEAEIVKYFSGAVHVIGDGTKRLIENLPELQNKSGARFETENYNLVRGEVLLAKASEYMRIALELGGDLPEAQPLYLRGADVSTSKKTYRTMAAHTQNT